MNTLTRKPNSSVEVTVSAPGESTKAAYEKACNELSKNVTIAGFRKGAKIPAQVLENALAAKGGRTALRAEAIKALVSQLVEPALKSEGVEPIGQPTLVKSAEELAETFVPGEPIDILIACDVWPELTWKSASDDKKAYEGLKGSYKRKPFDQAKYDVALNDLRERYAELAPSDNPLSMGDACIVNMEGFMANEDGSKGEPLPAGTASGDSVEIVLGEGRYMEGLVEGLIGATAGDTRTVSVSFPDKLKDKTLAGKRAVFDVTVLEAKIRTLPEVTDEFAKKVRADLTVEKLEAELRKAIDNEDAQAASGDRNKALSDALSEVVELEIPDTIVTQQAKEKFAMMMTEMRTGGTPDAEIKKLISPENFQKYKDIFAPDIIKDFKISMAVDEIAKIEKVEVPPYQVDEQIGQLKAEAEKENQEFDEATIRPKVEATLQRRMVFDLLAEMGDLEVIYTEETEPEFDEALLQKLADESLEREKAVVDAEVVEGEIVESSEEVIAEVAVVEESIVEEAVAEAATELEEPTEPVEEVVVEENSAMEDPVPEPEPVVEETEDEKAARYAVMSEEDRAFAILTELGIVGQTADPDSDNYDASNDDDFCDDYN